MSQGVSGMIEVLALSGSSANKNLYNTKKTGGSRLFVLTAHLKTETKGGCYAGPSRTLVVWRIL